MGPETRREPALASCPAACCFREQASLRERAALTVGSGRLASGLTRRLRDASFAMAKQPSEDARSVAVHEWAHGKVARITSFGGPHDARAAAERLAEERE